ncbi:ABC transporter ATP-binding protein [Rapidithrix thailandica]|uniref:ABC transporter ATP-binding protein n=1 Tax=Rapidithrix thailandica TaxID=413964 RepID=A0AAW9S1F6_9BACT
MKTYLRLIEFAKPIGPFLAPYLVLITLASIFSLANFAILMPLLEILFGTMKPVAETTLSLQDFELSKEFITGYFYQEFGSIIHKHGQLQALFALCIVVIVASLLANTFRYIAKRMSERLRAKTTANIRKAIYAKVLEMDIGFFTNQRKGDIISRATNDVLVVEQSITQSITTFFRESVNLIVFFASLFAISPELTFFTLAIIPISGGGISYIAKKLKRHSHRVQEVSADLVSVLDETIGGMRVVKAFNGEPFFRKKFQQENNRYVQSFVKEANRRELASPFSEVMGVFFVAVLLYYGGSLVLGNQSSLEPSQFIGYIILFTQVLNPAKTLSAAIGTIQRGLAAGERTLDFLEIPSAIQDHPSCKELERFDHNIEFRDVRFAYDEKEVLKGIDLSIPKGKTVALVGTSGGGKSTIADLIPRFYEPKSGSILIDGEDVNTYSLHSLRKQLGVVTQESILFHDSIFNNIAYGDPNAKLEDVIQAAKIANAHDFIMQTEKGYDTVIGDRGAKLSGGQRQRLSIARAIFKNPPILILDEATSALDTESEKLVQEAITHLMKNRTSLVIAHRLSTIQDADVILVVKDGEIVERGTHDELMQYQSGIYHNLQQMQSTT